MPAVAPAIGAASPAAVAASPSPGVAPVAASSPGAAIGGGTAKSPPGSSPSVVGPPGSSPSAVGLRPGAPGSSPSAVGLRPGRRDPHRAVSGPSSPTPSPGAVKPPPGPSPAKGTLVGVPNAMPLTGSGAAEGSGSAPGLAALVAGRAAAAAAGEGTSSTPARPTHTLAFSDLLLPRSAEPMVGPAPTPLASGPVSSPAAPAASPQAPAVSAVSAASPHAPTELAATAASPHAPTEPVALAPSPQLPAAPDVAPDAASPTIPTPPVTVAPVLLGAPGSEGAGGAPAGLELARPLELSPAPPALRDEGGIVAQVPLSSLAEFPSEPPRPRRSRIVWGTVGFLLAGRSPARRTSRPWSAPTPRSRPRRPRWGLPERTPEATAVAALASPSSPSEAASGAGASAAIEPATASSSGEPSPLASAAAAGEPASTASDKLAPSARASQRPRQRVLCLRVERPRVGCLTRRSGASRGRRSLRHPRHELRCGAPHLRRRKDGGPRRGFPPRAVRIAHREDR